MAVCEYGVAAQDREVLERVDACYRWAREMGDPDRFLRGNHAGRRTLPGAPGQPVEICEVADMVWLALTLTREGFGGGAYIDDVDAGCATCMPRARCWMLNSSTTSRMTASSKGITDTPYPDTDNVLERSVGSFLGWMRANEGFERQWNEDGEYKLTRKGIMHCCTANGARTLYCVWDSACSAAMTAARPSTSCSTAPRPGWTWPAGCRPTVACN